MKSKIRWYCLVLFLWPDCLIIYCFIKKISDQSSLTLAVEWNKIMAGMSSDIKMGERNADGLLASIIGEIV